MFPVNGLKNQAVVMRASELRSEKLAIVGQALVNVVNMMVALSWNFIVGDVLVSCPPFLSRSVRVARLKCAARVLRR